MPPSANADLSSLAALAQTRDGDLRPVLLQAQTQLFVNGRRDPDAVATFEALALGLIPLVGREILVRVAAALAPVTEAPPGVLSAIAARLGAHSDGDDTVAGGDAATLALARNPEIVLDGHRLEALVDRARTWPALAQAILARPEPSVFDRAALYRFATSPQRAEIRANLGPRLLSGSTPRLALSSAMRETLLATPDGPRTAIMLAKLGLGPTPEAAAAGLVGERVEQELFALALLALGLTAEECITVFLTLDRSIAHSVETILHLAGIVRSTAPAVATYLATADTQLVARHPPAHQRAAEPTGGRHWPAARTSQAEGSPYPKSNLRQGSGG